jgi:hypothetical protein
MWNVSGALGKFFFVAGLLPAVAFLTACDLLIVPGLSGGQHLADIEFLAIKGAVYLIGGTFLGLLLLALNTPIIRLYENGFFVAGWLKRRNQAQCRQRYTALAARQDDYRTATERGEGLQDAIAKLEGVYEAIEVKHGFMQTLPHDPAFVMPTALGNAFAVIEEYPYERYGMDAMVYWPRLATVVPADYQAQIADLKTTLDLSLNLSLLSGIFGAVALGMGIGERSPVKLICGLAALALACGFYRMGVGATYELGAVIRTSFDLFRGVLLEKYGLSSPASLNAERRQWKLLASFMRRGEEFYFPLETETSDDALLLQQELSRHTHNLNTLRVRAAVYAAGETPLFLQNQIDAELQAIEEVKARLDSCKGHTQAGSS